MRTHYPDQIKEQVEELEHLERRLRGQDLCDRVKMLRLLKTGAYDSRRTLAPTLGYSERQLQRWWKMYKKGGLGGLLEKKAVGGSTERMTDDAWTALRSEMRNGHIKQLKEAQAYLIEHFDIEYASLQGLSDMIRRRSIADMEAMRASAKTTAPPSSPPPAQRTGTANPDGAAPLVLQAKPGPVVSLRKVQAA